MFIPTYVLVILLFIVVWILYQKPSLIASKPEIIQSQNDNNNDNKAAFYDAITSEITALRQLMIRINVTQERLGWEKYFNKDYLCKRSLYSRYQKHYVESIYTPPGKNDERGSIILIVGEDVFGDIEYYNYEMTADNLILLHKGLKNNKQFKKGDFIKLYMEEKDVCEQEYIPLKAEIVSVKKRNAGYMADTEITLKIDVNSSKEEYCGSKPEANYLVRTISLMRNHENFIDDENIKSH